jgi:hypothetical protein
MVTEERWIFRRFSALVWCVAFGGVWRYARGLSGGASH